MARPGWDVKQAREAAGLKAVALARSLSLPDYTIRRIERSILAPSSTAVADSIITALPTLSARAKFLLRSLVREQDGPDTALTLPGTAGSYASTPDSAGISIVGDLDLRCRLEMVDWTPAALSTLIAKFNNSGAQNSYRLAVDTTGALQLGWSANGTTLITKQSTVAPGFIDGSDHWVRATLDVDNGATGNDVAFYTSENGVAWTQLGATVTTAAVTSVFDSATALVLGTRSDDSGERLAGKAYYAEVRSGIAGAVAAKFDPTTSASPTAPKLPVTFVSATGETWTLNGTGWTWVQAD